MFPSLFSDFHKPSEACLKRLYWTVMSPSAKYPCYSCFKDISNFTTIFTNQHFYCVGCFAKMTETPNYYVLSKLSFPIIQDAWSTKQQLLLLEGLEKHYFGNWIDIAIHIGTDKSAEDVENHYLKYYIQTEDSMPKLNQEIRPINYKVLGKRKFMMKMINDDVSSERQSRLKPVKKKPKLHQSIAEILGYNAKREDFEIEYDNDAQMLIADLQFNEEDTAEERNLKFRILQIFNRRMDERIKRKKFVIQRNLINLQHLTLQQKDKSKSEKEVYGMMRPFARFHPPQDHEKLVAGIIKARNIRLTIEQLKFYKEKGFKNMVEIENELKKKTKKARGTEPRTRRSANYESNSIKKAKVEIRESELRLIKQLEMEIESYAMVKEVILRESAQNGILQMQNLRRMFSLNKKALGKIVAELVKNEQIIQPN